MADTIGPTPERLARAGENVEAYRPSKSENWRAVRLLDHPRARVTALALFE
jgi:hypothetical protein